jgi:hypothetical protein
MAEPQTHDYRRAARGWGHDLGYEVGSDGNLHAWGWGSGIAVGDYMLLTNKDHDDADTRYRVSEIRYAGDPPDMWFGVLDFAPRAAAPLNQPGPAEPDTRKEPS